MRGTSDAPTPSASTARERCRASGTPAPWCRPADVARRLEGIREAPPTRGASVHRRARGSDARRSLCAPSRRSFGLRPRGLDCPPYPMSPRRSPASALRLRSATAAVLVAVLFAIACSSTPDGGSPLPSSTSAEGSSPSVTPSGPTPTNAPGFTEAMAESLKTRWPIKHVVFLVKENRTFDRLFGTCPGANGQTWGMDNGVRRPLTRGTDQRQPDIPHCYECSIAAWDHGKMDGFNQSEPANRWAYTQLHKDQLPNYWHWARQNVLADNFFSSAQGPSFPNHLYTIAAQSGGAHDNPRRIPGITHGSNTFGCDAPKTQNVEVEEPNGTTRMVPPCFNIKTEGDLLNRRGIPWSFYAATQDQKGYIWSAYSAIRKYREDPQNWNQHIFPVDNVIQDIKADSLPPVTW